ncbi:MAG TPA: hypothetical protein VMU22_06435 [Rhizomicrobium sp.]|nr:hypothetical protein [Rhizomicrobium sp.]
MRHSRIFALCIGIGAVIVAWLADQNTSLALFMGAAIGAAVAVMIVAFPLDLSYREPLRGKRTVHVVMTPPESGKR